MLRGQRDPETLYSSQVADQDIKGRFRRPECYQFARLCSWGGDCPGRESQADKRLCAVVCRMHIKGSGIYTRDPSAIIYLFAPRQRQCCSLKTSSQHSSPLRQSVSMDSPSSSRSERIQFTSAPIAGTQPKLSNVPKGNNAAPRGVTQSTGQTVCASQISASSTVRSAPSILVPKQGVFSTREPKFLFSIFLLFYGGFFNTLSRCGCIIGISAVPERSMRRGMLGIIGRILSAVGIILLPRSDAITGAKELDLGPEPEPRAI